LKVQKNRLLIRLIFFLLSFEFFLPLLTEQNDPPEAVVNVTIYNILGQKVKTCVNQNMTAGYYDYIWDGKDDNGTDVSSGVYIYRLGYDNNQVSKLMLFLK
jgi:flagellar hook assembly protein FlgD